MSGETWKRQTYWSLPVYTGDVSGVCSALYELGGMVVMHDPSGCNSTYNTHDEIRWMEMESLIFLSGLKDIDAITGNDRKLIDDIAEAARAFHPAFIAIANSPVPWLIGTDFRSVCNAVRQETGIPAFHVETNAMHDYTYGAGHAFLELARMLFDEEDAARDAGDGKKDAPDRESGPVQTDARSRESGPVQKDAPDRESGSGQREDACGTSGPGRLLVNVLGMTPLDFTVRSQVQTLRELLSGYGFDTVSVWGIGDGLECLKKAPEADVNLVVSSAGMMSARYLEERFGIPYVAGVPIGAFTDTLMRSLADAAASGKSRIAYLDVLETVRSREAGARSSRAVAGESVTMGSVAASLALTDGNGCDIVCLTEETQSLLGSRDTKVQGEAQIRQVLGGYDEVTADPMLRHVCRKDALFHELPHFAYSGRLYLGKIPTLIG